MYKNKITLIVFLVFLFKIPITRNPDNSKSFQFPLAIRVTGVLLWVPLQASRFVISPPSLITLLPTKIKVCTSFKYIKQIQQLVSLLQHTMCTNCDILTCSGSEFWISISSPTRPPLPSRRPKLNNWASAANESFYGISFKGVFNNALEHTAL